MLALLLVSERCGIVMSMELRVGDTAAGCAALTSNTKLISPTCTLAGYSTCTRSVIWYPLTSVPAPRSSTCKPALPIQTHAWRGITPSPWTVNTSEAVSAPITNCDSPASTALRIPEAPWRVIDQSDMRRTLGCGSMHSTAKKPFPQDLAGKAMSRHFLSV